MAADQHAIFICYRRDDTADTAGRLFDNLERALGEDRVFKDVDSIPLGMDFGAYIPTIIRKCRVFLTLIGPTWAQSEGDGGARRLNDPKDFVRLEIETALQTEGVQVIPLLVNGAEMPKRDELPESLRPIVGFHAAQIRRDPDFKADVERLIRAVQIGSSEGASVTVAAPTFSEANPQGAWASIESSLDTRDYEDYIAVFASAPNAFEARRRKRQLDDWARLSKDDPQAIAAFQRNPLFAALAAEVTGALQRIQHEQDAKNRAEEERGRREREAQALADQERRLRAEASAEQRRQAQRAAAEAERRREAEEADRRASAAQARRRFADQARRLGPVLAVAVAGLAAMVLVVGPLLRTGPISNETATSLQDSSNPAQRLASVTTTNLPQTQPTVVPPPPSTTPPGGTVINDQEAYNRLMGATGLTLQWVSMSSPGRLTVSRDQAGFVQLRGSQGNSSGGTAISLQGRVLEIDSRSFKFEGEITIIEPGAESYGVTSPCTRRGVFTFRHFPPRQYWRLREQEYSCRGVLTDYVDIHF